MIGAYHFIPLEFPKKVTNAILEMLVGLAEVQRTVSPWLIVHF